MGLNLEQKKAVVAEVSAQVAKAQAIIIAEYRGLEVGVMTALRAKAMPGEDPNTIPHPSEIVPYLVEMASPAFARTNVRFDFFPDRAYIDQNPAA